MHPPPLRAGSWLGIDVGSSRAKVVCFCLVESDGSGEITVSFERGPAEAPYPRRNRRRELIDPARAPTYLRAEVEAAVRRVVDGSELVGRWLQGGSDGSIAAGIDAPPATATAGSQRLTEEACSPSIRTPDRPTFETQLASQGDPFLRINAFWKCVGFALYRHLALRLGGGVAPGQATLAAWTCPDAPTPWRLRETFPSDVYKRANGDGSLTAEAARVLTALVAPRAHWRGTGEAPRRRPGPRLLDRLDQLRRSLCAELAAATGHQNPEEPTGPAARPTAETVARPLPTMRKHPGTAGDLWDAFTCAFTVCCEAHGATESHGWSDDPALRERLHREGVILTVAEGATPLAAPPRLESRAEVYHRRR